MLTVVTNSEVLHGEGLHTVPRALAALAPVQRTKDWGGAALPPLGLDMPRRTGEGRTAGGSDAGTCRGNLGVAGLDPFQHTVDWDTARALPNSGTINPQRAAGDKYTTPPMNTAGTFAYHCAFHGIPTTGMRGSLTVNP